jgi:hypothetical protein
MSLRQVLELCKRRNSQISKNRQDSIADISPFALLSEDTQHVDEQNADTIAIPSIELVPESRNGRPLRPSRKRQQDNSPPAPPPAAKRRTQTLKDTADNQVLKALERIEAALARSEERAVKAEKRVEELEKTVKSLLTQLKPTVTQPGSSPASSPSPSLTLLRAEAPAYRLPGINLDLSAAPQLHDKNPNCCRATSKPPRPRIK